ncbi:hypothetical protein JCM19992_17690 [Thermostilla marina]
MSNTDGNRYARDAKRSRVGEPVLSILKQKTSVPVNCYSDIINMCEWAEVIPVVPYRLWQLGHKLNASGPNAFS